MDELQGTWVGRPQMRPDRAFPRSVPRESGGWLSIDELLCLGATKIRLRRGARLYRSADRFEFIFLVRFGFLKSTAGTDDGREQIIGFHLAGDLLGFDGIATQTHCCEMTALENCELVAIPYSLLRSGAAESVRLRDQIQCAMSGELIREQKALLLLGKMKAEQRVACFLLDLAQRFKSRGYSRSEFVLRMTRAEIGSYLGVTLETISRCLSRFARDGLITCSGRQIRITEPDALERLVMGGDAAQAA